jgi:hypothetical protein
MCFAVTVEEAHIFVALGFCNCAQSHRGVKIRQMIVSVQKWPQNRRGEILVADTDLESGVEACDEEKEEEGGGGGQHAS